LVSELSADNAADWLAAHGLPSTGLRFAELGGGISNKLVLAEGPEFRAVLKQSLGQLRTRLEWNSDRQRIFREAAAMRWLAGKAGHIPTILFEDRTSFTIAMEAAPNGSEMWKTQLFRGVHDPDVAWAAGAALGAIIRTSWNDRNAELLFGDQSVFVQLRIDPYYRFTAQNRPEAEEYIEKLIGQSAARRVSLVHGDWSPKNLLVHGRQVWAIDWEVIHFGDPSFDVGFLLNHLLMKSIAMPQYSEAMKGLARSFLGGLDCELPPDSAWIVRAALEHLPALLLARVDGKSPAEYLDARMLEGARSLALNLMVEPAESAEELFER